ncbi:hypothetical protein KY360_01565 [Candidatus Woesearchaeota archaeon]|nr:hypothetical protein [Candidatus Woesearchaeota archaeon]
MDPQRANHKRSGHYQVPTRSSSSPFPKGAERPSSQDYAEAVPQSGAKPESFHLEDINAVDGGLGFLEDQLKRGKVAPAVVDGLVDAVERLPVSDKVYRRAYALVDVYGLKGTNGEIPTPSKPIDNSREVLGAAAKIYEAEPQRQYTGGTRMLGALAALCISDPDTVREFLREHLSDLLANEGNYFRGLLGKRPDAIELTDVLKHFRLQ